MFARWAKRAISVAGGRIVTVAAAAVGIRALTTILDPSVYGEYRLIVGLSALLLGVAFRPLTAYAMRVIHDAKGPAAQARVAATARRSLMAIAIAVAPLVAALAAVASIALAEAWPLVLASGVVVLAAATVGTGLENGLLVTRGKVSSAAFWSSVAAVGTVMAAIAAAMAMPEHAVALVLAQAGVLAVVAAVLRRRYVAAGHGDVLPWLRNSITFTGPLAYVGGVSWAFNLGDRYLLAFLTSTQDVGVYAAAYGLAATPLAAIGGLIPTLAYEPIFRTAVSGAEERRWRLVNRVLFVQMVAVAGSVVMVVIMAPLGAAVLLGAEFQQDAIAVIRWVAVGQGLHVSAYVLDIESDSVSETSRRAVAYSAAAVAAVLANLVLIPVSGVVGAAQATALSGLAYFGVMVALAHRSAHTRVGLVGPEPMRAGEVGDDAPKPMDRSADDEQ